MKVGLCVHFFLFLFVCCFYSCDGYNQGMKCVGYFKKSYEQINGDKYNYCWKFLPQMLKFNIANSKCHSFGGRLVAVTSASKAKKLSAFVKEIIQYYKSGKKGLRFKKEFQNGFPNGEIWISDIKDGKWRAKGLIVKKDATSEKSLKPGARCVVFNYVTAKWRYEKCAKKYYMICEDIRPVYPDDVGAEDMTTPSYSLPPTQPPPKGAKLSCPPRYDRYGKHCYFVSQARETQAAAEKRCHKTGGNLVWISDSSKKMEITRYIKSHRGKFKKIRGNAWLGQLTGNGFILKWKEIGTNARYFLNVNRMQNLKILKKGIMPKLYISVTGSIAYCTNQRNCMNRGALCESARRVLTGQEKNLAVKIKAKKVKKAKTAKKRKKIIKRKPKIAKTNKKQKKSHRPNSPKRKPLNHKKKISRHRNNKKSKSRSTKQVKKQQKNSQRHKISDKTLNRPQKQRRKNIKKTQKKYRKNSKRPQKYYRNNSKRPQKKNHKHAKKPLTQHLEKSKVKDTKKISTHVQNSMPKPNEPDEATSMTEQEKTNPTPIEVGHVTKQMEPHTIDVSAVNDITPVEEDQSKNKKRNLFLQASGSSGHMAFKHYQFFMFTYTILSNKKIL